MQHRSRVSAWLLNLDNKPATLAQAPAKPPPGKSSASYAGQVVGVNISESGVRAAERSLAFTQAIHMHEPPSRATTVCPPPNVSVVETPRHQRVCILMRPLIDSPQGFII